MSSDACLIENRPRQTGLAWINAVPKLTLLIAAIAIALGIVPGCAAAMSYQREAIGHGQVWRLVTGHLTHWTADHLLWDVVMFVVLSCIVEQRGRAAAVRLLFGSAALISLSLWTVAPEIAEYRGLSGIDSALFTYVAILLARDAMATRRHAQVAFLALLLAAFAGKIGYELATGATLFVDSHGGGFTPLPLVHIVGAAAGSTLAVLDGRGRA